MERRRQTSLEQLALMIDFLEAHKELALGKVRSKEARAVASRLWQDCSLKLNAEGPARSSKEWSKVWNDLKCRVRTKLVNITKANQQTGGPSTAILTELEKRVASILVRDVGPIPNVKQEQLATHDDDHLEVTNAAEMQEHGDGVSDNMLAINDSKRDSPILLLSPSLSGRVPSPISSQITLVRTRIAARKARRRRFHRRYTVPPHPTAQSDRTWLNEYQAMILKIERMRVDAALRNAQTFEMLAESFKVLAGAVDKLAMMFRRNGDSN